MKVFISWSGERSRQVAELFKIWLKCVLQNSEPWVSTEDIESGSIWFNEIGSQLSETTVGIICLTKENKDKPWILFEAGALSKGLSNSRVCPFLIDLQTIDLRPPLSQLNVSEPTENSLLKLVKTINNSLKEEGLPIEVLTKVFSKYWPDFDQSIKEILAKTPEIATSQARGTDDILGELLTLVRGFDNRVRKLEANRTLDTNSYSNPKPSKGFGRSPGSGSSNGSGSGSGSGSGGSYSDPYIVVQNAVSKYLDRHEFPSDSIAKELMYQSVAATLGMPLGEARILIQDAFDMIMSQQ